MGVGVSHEREGALDEREQQRKVRHRLAILRYAEEVSGNVAATCRYYEIFRPVFYKWRRRYDELGEAGLRENASRPHDSPKPLIRRSSMSASVSQRCRHDSETTNDCAR